jgi:hypothetical protein
VARTAPRIGNDIFLKLFTHGTQERHSKYLLEGGLEHTLSVITTECERADLDLHFSTAWEMRQAVDAAVRGDVRLMRQPQPTSVTGLKSDMAQRTAAFRFPAAEPHPPSESPRD